LSHNVVLKKLILLGNRIPSVAIERLVSVALTEECPVRHLDLKQNKIDQNTKNKLVLLIDHFNNREQKNYDNAISAGLLTTRDKVGSTKTMEDDSISSLDKSKLLKKQPSFLARKQSFASGKKEFASDSEINQSEVTAIINHTKHIYL